MMVSTISFIYVGTFLFVVGILGVLLRRNAIVILMSIELMLNGVILMLLAFSKQMNLVDGHIFVFFIMAVAAAEAAVGLAIIVAVFRNEGSASVDDVNLLKW